jgi:hypothetical protein
MKRFSVFYRGFSDANATGRSLDRATGFSGFRSRPTRGFGITAAWFRNHPCPLKRRFRQLAQSLAGPLPDP